MVVHRSALLDEEPSIVGEAHRFAPPNSYRSSDGVLASNQLLDLIGRLEAGNFLLSGGHYSGIDLRSAADACFIEIPELAYGREESAHGVFFGQLMVETEADGEAPEIVAIKPYDRAADAVHEFAVMTLVNMERGAGHRPLAFQPIGFCALGDEGIGLISEYEHDVQSFDNIFWDEAEHPDETRIGQALRQMGFALGATHALGFTQGDAQVKNMARGNQGPRIIDHEESRTFPTAYDGRDERIFEGTVSDVRMLTDSLYIPSEHPDGRYTNQIIADFLPNYLRTTHLPSSRIPSAARVGINQLRKELNL